MHSRAAWNTRIPSKSLFLHDMTLWYFPYNARNSGSDVHLGDTGRWLQWSPCLDQWWPSPLANLGKDGCGQKFQNLLQHSLFSLPNIMTNATGNIELLVLHPYAEKRVYLPKIIWHALAWITFCRWGTVVMLALVANRIPFRKVLLAPRPICNCSRLSLSIIHFVQKTLRDAEVRGRRLSFLIWRFSPSTTILLNASMVLSLFANVSSTTCPRYSSSHFDVLQYRTFIAALLKTATFPSMRVFWSKLSVIAYGVA